MTSSSMIRYYLTATLCLLAPLVSVAQHWGGDKHDYLLPFNNDHLLSFEVPGGKATYPLAINENRTVTGYYVTMAGVTSGFVREEDGQITTFDVPGSVLTEPVSINIAGDITGFYELASGTPGYNIAQGFIRSANGTIATFGNPADTYQGTSFWAQPVAINDAGEVVGNYPNLTYSGVVFIRSATGSFDGFTLSDGASYPTFVTGLNNAGKIVGYSTSGSFLEAEGFLIDSHAPLPSPVDSTGVTFISVTGGMGTFPTAINADETVVGCYFANNVYQDFVRYHDGVIQTLNIPGTIPACLPGFSGLGIFNVNPTSITVNGQGTITGYYINQNKVARGFVRSDDGKVVTFGHRDATQTIPTAINDRGAITGYYSQGPVTRGFIREP